MPTTEPTSQSDNESHSQRAYYAWIGAILFAIGFTVLISGLSPSLGRFPHLPDQGPEWYYWKLPTGIPLDQVIVWTFYLVHQFALWGAIYWAQKNLKDVIVRRNSGLTRYNYAAFSINTIFIALHLVQTHIWYDGLAQTVPIWTSQGSVIVMLVFILIIEHPRRGLFLGRKINRPISAQVSGFFRRNHSYVFSWAVVYTFWFHPMDGDAQLLSGFFYMFLLFTQINLAYTKIHLDRRWIISLESFVAVHALVVAYFNTVVHGSPDMWPMFLSGFVFMFVFTYIYALDVKREVYAAVTILYILFITWIYLPAPFGYGRSLLNLFRLEMLWIPIILYGLAIVIAGATSLYIKRVKPSTQPENGN
ncbi:MAG: hypothetical protein JSW61_05530 [Candidatus Thorarchaeota archaeon]|nr:MAG: hypothetical protein JSW61_05530 [Candidatus Thorarchaeota archaeon]